MRYSLLFSIVFALVAATVHAEDLIVELGKSETIDSERELAAPDQYENKGTVTITAAGILKIGDGVTNVEPLGEGISGLDLGVLNSAGSIEAETFLRFQAGSMIDGSLVSTEGIAFDGISTIIGNVQTKQLILNAGSETKGEYFLIDLAGTIATFDVDELIVGLSTNIMTHTGLALELGSLYIGGTETGLSVSGDLIVHGNYTGVAGTGLVTGKDEDGNYAGTVTLLGGGDLEGGENNVIAQSVIYAGELQVKNHTAITRNLEVTGDFRILNPDTDEDAESRTLLYAALLTDGKTYIENGGILRFDIAENESSLLHTYGYFTYSGVFLGGLDMKDGSVMDVVDDDQSVKLALGGDSTIAEGAEIKVGSLSLTGVSTTDSDSGKVVAFENRGLIRVADTLQLSNVELTNTGVAALEVNAIKMIGSSVLEIAGTGTLTFTGENRQLDIGASSSIMAKDMTLDFTGVEIINKNTSISYAITADTIILGEGSSLSGGGFYETAARFETGSTLKLDNMNYYSFETNDVLFQEGAMIEITISTNGLRPVITEGVITMEDGVILSITDGSEYTGRTRQFQILQGAEESDLKALTLAESLFFGLNDTLFDGAGGLWVEIVKVNELVDYAKSSNQKNISTMIDTLLNEGRVSDDQKTVFNALMRIASDDQFRQTLNELSGSSRENAILFALSSPWERPFNSVGFNRLSLALPMSHPESDPDDPILRGREKSWMPGMPKMSMPKWNRPRWSFSHDLWADLYYDYTKFSDDGNAPGGHGNRGGFHAGTALPSPSRDSLLGISVGYSAGEYKQARDKADLGDFRIGLYGGVNLFGRNLQLRGYVGYGMQDYKYKRAPQIGSYEPLDVSGDTDGDSVSAAIYLIRPMDLSTRYLFKPMIGFDMERITQDGFTENGIAAVALDYGDTSLNRVMWRLGVSGDYEYSDRTELNWRFLAGLKISGDNTVSSTHRFMSPSNDPFQISSISLGDYAFDLGFGGNWKLNRRRTVLLFLDYNANFIKNGARHTSSLGLLWKR